MVHIYCGDGKGKTTAAVGLALRCAGSGGKVLFCGFLKDGKSSEIKVLEKTENITVMPFLDNVRFSFKMTENEKNEAAQFYTKQLETAAKSAKNYDMLVLDEIFHAVNKGFAPITAVLEMIENTPDTEIVLTGRDPAEELCKAADYITEMKKIKHPFDNGIKARKGIEF